MEKGRLKGGIIMYITVYDDIITGLFDGDLIDFRSTAREGHRIEYVPQDCTVEVGDPISFYDKNWKRFTRQELMNKGLIPIPEGYSLKNGKLVQLEKKLFVVDEELIESYTAPKGAELYDKDLFFIDENGRAKKKDSQYYLHQKKLEVIKLLDENDKKATPRLLREVALGEKEAIRVLSEIDETAKKLRKKLNDLK